MSYLLFMDESGHHGARDAYEVRGGIALPSSNVWGFTRKMRGLEGRCFGDLLQNHGSEIKAVKLFERRRIRLAKDHANFSDEERQALCRVYLGQKRNKTEPTHDMASAYAQAGLLFVNKLLDLIKQSGGTVFASVVPANYGKPPVGISSGYVRKDICFLFERFYSFLEEKQDDGMLVLDETDRADDKKFLGRMERYFSAHEKGKQHAKLVLPTPLFTASDMSYPVQAADVVIYLIAHGYRLPNMTVAVRDDLKKNWIDKVARLQFETRRTDAYGTSYTLRSIVYVPDPWSRRG